MTSLLATLESIKVLPVLTVTSCEQTLLLVGALRAGGIKAVEITLRSEGAMDAIREVKALYPDMIVSAGTVLNPQNLEMVANAGVDFAVSPGLTKQMVQAAQEFELPYLPGVSTSSEVMAAIELGLDSLKLFPAAAVGGMKLLQSFSDVFPGVKFCPTGGINSENYQNHLSLPNVVCIGGSWFATTEAVSNMDWSTVSAQVGKLMSSIK